MLTSRLPVRLAPHLVAATLALVYAWTIFRSPFVRSGLQFVGPLLMIVACHAAWVVLAGQAKPGYARTVLRRTAHTALGVAGAVLLVETLAPMPGEAAGGDAGGLLVILACLFVLGAVIAALALVIYATYHALAALFRRGRDTDRTNDLGALVAVAVVLLAASLEGVPGFHAFDGRGQATATVRTEATPAAVWQAMETATSPSYPLPAILQSLPQPVAVTTDEGVALGANRVVRIAGREGMGDLSLRVVERDATRVRFDVVSDTSPTANWVAFEDLSYEVLPEGKGAHDGTRVSVTLRYKSLLAPAWVFVPLVDGAAHLAARVLARDTAERAASRTRRASQPPTPPPPGSRAGSGTG